MSKKTTFVLLGALILLLGGYFAFFYKWHGPDNEFFITDPNAVGKIEIEKFAMSASQEKIVLEVQKGDAWTVNGQYPASESKMKDFLKTLQEIRVLQPIEPKGQGPALSLLKRNHIHVRIWDRQGSELKDYLIGATNSTQTANVFKMDYSDKCYLVTKPAMQGYVSIFYATDLLSWREKLLWNVAGNDLAEIAVTYVPDSLNESFVLKREGLDWMLAAANQENGGVKAEQNRVNAYTGLFEGKVFAESFADAAFPGILDSLSHKRTPEARIRLTTQDQQSTELLLFARPENSNGFFGYLAPAKELMTVQHFVIDKYLKRRSYFMQQTQQP